MLIPTQAKSPSSGSRHDSRHPYKTGTKHRVTDDLEVLNCSHANTVTLSVILLFCTSLDLRQASSAAVPAIDVRGVSQLTPERP